MLGFEPRQRGYRVSTAQSCGGVGRGRGQLSSKNLSLIVALVGGEKGQSIPGGGDSMKTPEELPGIGLRSWEQARVAGGREEGPVREEGPAASHRRRPSPDLSPPATAGCHSVLEVQRPLKYAAGIENTWHLEARKKPSGYSFVTYWLHVDTFSLIFGVNRYYIIKIDVTCFFLHFKNMATQKC